MGPPMYRFAPSRIGYTVTHHTVVHTPMPHVYERSEPQCSATPPVCSDNTCTVSPHSDSHAMLMVLYLTPVRLSPGVSHPHRLCQTVTQTFERLSITLTVTLSGSASPNKAQRVAISSPYEAKRLRLDSRLDYLSSTMVETPF